MCFSSYKQQKYIGLSKSLEHLAEKLKQAFGQPGFLSFTAWAGGDQYAGGISVWCELAS